LSNASEKTLGIRLDSTFFPTTEAFDTEVRSSVTSAKAYPIFDWHADYQMQDLAGRNLLVDLSDLWKKGVAAGEYTSSEQKQFEWANVPYGLPKLINYWVIFYNKKVFAAHGIKPPSTWAELLDICAKLKAGGVYPFGVNLTDPNFAAFQYFQEVLVRTSSNLYTEVLSGKVAYDDPNVLAAAQHWIDLLKKQYITPPGLITLANSTPEFVKGAYAMALIGDWATTSFEQAGMVPEKDFGVFVAPPITPAGTSGLIVEARPVVLATAAEQKDEALRFANWFMGVEAATIWAKALKISSPNAKVADSTRPPHLRELAAAVGASKYQLLTRWYEGTPNPVVNAVLPLLNKIALHPDEAPSILKQAQEAAVQARATS
jgi:multiple sugar transport system substrate-binding protein